MGQVGVKCFSLKRGLPLQDRLMLRLMDVHWVRRGCHSGNTQQQDSFSGMGGGYRTDGGKNRLKRLAYLSNHSSSRWSGDPPPSRGWLSNPHPATEACCGLSYA